MFEIEIYNVVPNPQMVLLSVKRTLDDGLPCKRLLGQSRICHFSDAMLPDCCMPHGSAHEVQIQLMMAWKASWSLQFLLTLLLCARWRAYHYFQVNSAAVKECTKDSPEIITKTSQADLPFHQHSS